MPSDDPALFYTGLVAEAYGALRSQTFDPARYAAFVRRCGEPALEVGCGDGHPLLDLVADGLQVDGIDSSPDMIDRARRAARDRGLSVRLDVALMQELDLGQQYRSIYLAGPTFELLPDDTVALGALVSFRRHLHQDGVLLLPLWVADPTPAVDLGVARESTDGSGTVLRYTPVSEQYDVDARTRLTDVRYERIRPDGSVETVEKQWLIHWQTLASITALAERAGLRVAAVDPDPALLSGRIGEEFCVELTPA